MHQVIHSFIWSGAGEADGKAIEEEGAGKDSCEDEAFPDEGDREAGGTAHQEDEDAPEVHTEEEDKEGSSGDMVLTPGYQDYHKYQSEDDFY